MLCVPAGAIDLSFGGGGTDGDATASTTSNGGNARSSLSGGGTNATGTSSVSGSSGTANVTLGGVNGANGVGNAAINGTDGAGDVRIGGLNGTDGTGTAAIGGSGGAANVTIGGLNGTGGLGLGGIGTGGLNNPTTNPTNPGGPSINIPSSVIANMSDAELARYKKRCLQILGESGGFDIDLVALCKMLQTASR